MDPDKFRESRQAINRMYDDVNILIDDKNLEASTEGYEAVNAKLEKLTPQAEGEIQERSVKNLGIKVESLLTYIAKLKPKKKPRISNEKPIEWDEALVSKLSETFLKKVFANLSDDKEAMLYFSTSGKGIRPSYQIGFSNKTETAFSGSSHNPLKKLLSINDNRISQGFSHETVASILQKK